MGNEDLDHLVHRYLASGWTVETFVKELISEGHRECVPKHMSKKLELVAAKAELERAASKVRALEAE
jgi:hypothetical protein